MSAAAHSGRSDVSFPGLTVPRNSRRGSGTTSLSPTGGRAGWERVVLEGLRRLLPALGRRQTIAATVTRRIPELPCLGAA